jgi:hypothetical protein
MNSVFRVAQRRATPIGNNPIVVARCRATRSNTKNTVHVNRPLTIRAFWFYVIRLGLHSASLPATEEIGI